MGLTRFKSLYEDLSNLEYAGDDNPFAIKILELIDDSIGSINTEIVIDPRPAKQSGKKLGISQTMPNDDRPKYSELALQIIEDHPDMKSVKVSPARIGTDYAFKHKDMEKYVYVNVRPDGKRSALGDDPNELMTAALCLKPSLKIPENSDEMDLLIDEVENVRLKKVKGYKQTQVTALKGDYKNLCMAVSAAKAIHEAGYDNSDIAYLTAQAWDDDVKQFQISKHGMKDFNSSDFILQKGKNYLGVSLKKKEGFNKADPTLINKSFSTLFQDKKFDRVVKSLEQKTAKFYVRVLKDGIKKKSLPKSLLDDLEKTKPTVNNWKEFVQRVPNKLINDNLKGSRSLFKDISTIVLRNKGLFANQLIDLIFKAELTELKKVNFDFTLVTGIGDYGPKKGVVIEEGEYKDIETVSTTLQDLFKKGKVGLVLAKEDEKGKKIKQAFDTGSNRAVLSFDLKIGTTKIAYLTLRYKGNFRAAPSFLAVMHDDMKDIYK